MLDPRIFEMYHPPGRETERYRKNGISVDSSIRISSFVESVRPRVGVFIYRDPGEARAKRTPKKLSAHSCTRGAGRIFEIRHEIVRTRRGLVAQEDDLGVPTDRMSRARLADRPTSGN